METRAASSPNERCVLHGTLVLAGLPAHLPTWASAHLRIAPVPPDTTATTPAEVAPGLCVLCTVFLSFYRAEGLANRSANQNEPAGAELLASVAATDPTALENE
jgi:hypothetical protein